MKGRYDKVHLPPSFELEINSHQIVKVLKEVVDYYPQYSLEAESITLPDPYRLLFHHRKKLVDHLHGPSTNDETRQHLALLLDYMCNDMEKISQNLDSLEAQSEARDEKIICFSNCWLLFPPGSTVYSTQNGHLQAYVVEALSVMQRTVLPSGRLYSESLELKCWSIDYHGTHFGRKYTTLNVFEYHGSRLPVM